MQLTVQQKQQYLEALGVQTWYPRMRLTLAPEPVILQSPSDRSEQALLSPSPAIEPPTPVIERAHVPSGESVAPDPEPVPQSTQQETVKDAQAPNVIHFGLGLHVIGSWLIVSSLSADHNDRQEAAFRLLLAILKSLGTEEDEPAYHHVIAWPFFSNPNADQGKQAAHQYVNGVVEHLVEEHSISRILAFGGVLAKLNDWDSAEGDCFGLPRLNLPSLYKMLDDPRQKSKAWKLIQESSLYPS